jgi:hypothetical protein
MEDDPEVARACRAVGHLDAANDRVEEHIDVRLLPHFDLQLFGDEREIDDRCVAPFAELGFERVVDPAEGAVQEKADPGRTAKELMTWGEGGYVELAERA